MSPETSICALALGAGARTRNEAPASSSSAAGAARTCSTAEAHRLAQQAAQPQREEEVGQQHQQGGQQEPARQVGLAAFAQFVGRDAARQHQRLGLGHAAADVEGDLGVLVAIETGRRGRLGLESLVGVGRQDLRAGRRGAQAAEAVEGAPRLQRLVDAVAGDAARQGHQPLQHVHEQAAQRHVAPARVGGGVHQHQVTLAALLSGDQRRAVGQARPGLVGEVGRRLGQNLLGDAHVLGDRDAEERAVGRELGQRRRLAPAHDAAQRAVAQAERRRHQRVVAGGEVGAGEAHGHAAALDPLGDLVAVVGRGRRAVGDQQHGGVARQHRLAIADREADIGIEGAFEEVDLLHQRLAVGGRLLAQDGDRPAARAFVEQHHAARAALRLDVEPRHAVAQLGRRRQRAFALGGGGREIEIDAGHGAALLVGRLDGDRARAVGRGPQRLHLEVAAFGGGRQQQQRRGRLVGHDDLQAVEAAEALGELGGAFVLQPVAQPDDRGAGIDLHLVDGGGGRGAVGRPRLGPEGAQQRAGLVGPHRALAHRRRVDWVGGGAGEHDRAVGALGALDQAFGVGDARRPARRRRPAVVDHQHQRSLARQVGLRIEQRPGDRQDQRGGQQQAQQQQPPRHLARRLLGRLEPDQAAGSPGSAPAWAAAGSCAAASRSTATPAAAPASRAPRTRGRPDSAREHADARLTTRDSLRDCHTHWREETRHVQWRIISCGAARSVASTRSGALPAKIHRHHATLSRRRSAMAR